jgi:hypothetical protein
MNTLIPNPLTKEKKLEILLHLREALAERNRFMCLFIEAMFKSTNIKHLGLKGVLPELHKLRPKETSNTNIHDAWTINNISGSQEMWDFRKQAVEKAIRTIEKQK